MGKLTEFSNSFSCDSLKIKTLKLIGPGEKITCQVRPWSVTFTFCIKETFFLNVRTQSGRSVTFFSLKNTRQHISSFIFLFLALSLYNMYACYVPPDRHQNGNSSTRTWRTAKNKSISVINSDKVTFLRTNFSPSVTATLLEWLHTHKDFPYPNREQKKELAKKTNLTEQQVKNWFQNNRSRKGIARPAGARIWVSQDKCSIPGIIVLPPLPPSSPILLPPPQLLSPQSSSMQCSGALQLERQLSMPPCEQDASYYQLNTENILAATIHLFQQHQQEAAKDSGLSSGRQMAIPYLLNHY